MRRIVYPAVSDLDEAMKEVRPAMAKKNIA